MLELLVFLVTEVYMGTDGLQSDSYPGVEFLTNNESREIPRDSWDELSASINMEQGLLPCGPSALQHRYAMGHAALVMDRGRIIAYQSIIPILNSGLRQSLSYRFGIPISSFPSTSVCINSSAYTAPGWRNKGINTRLKEMLSPKDRNELRAGVTWAKPALRSNINAGIGAIDGNAYPYFSALLWYGPPSLGYGARSANLEIVEQWSSLAQIQEFIEGGADYSEHKIILASNEELVASIEMQFASLMRGLTSLYVTAIQESSYMNRLDSIKDPKLKLWIAGLRSISAKYNGWMGL